MISDKEMVTLLKSVARVVRDFSDKQTQPLTVRLDLLERRCAELQRQLDLHDLRERAVLPDSYAVREALREGKNS